MGQDDIDLDVADVTRAGACGNLAQLLGGKHLCRHRCDLRHVGQQVAAAGVNEEAPVVHVAQVSISPLRTTEMGAPA